MTDKAREIVDRWRSYIPPQVPIEDVETVAAAYFGATPKKGHRGSHWLVIHHPAIEQAYKHGMLPGCPGGHLSLSHVGGKAVKKYLVAGLLEAINAKEAYDRVMGEEK